MNLRIKHFVAFVTFLTLLSCEEKKQKLYKIEAKQLQIVDTIVELDSINEFIKPYTQSINAFLDKTLAYAPRTITKEDGKYNTSAGNLIADIIIEQANPIYKKRTGKEIDFVLLNHGGIRSAISKGDVNIRTAYEVMPFENTIVVVELPAKSVMNMIHYLIKSKRKHPFSGLQIVLDKESNLSSVNVKEKPFDQNKNYIVATSNYLLNGGDQMNFFEDRLNLVDTDYKIRNAMIDYFIKKDTIAPIIDNRFMKLN